jgi:Uma2 family endonuclease
VLRVHSALEASADSDLEPDIAVVPLGDYRSAHPDRALLVIEVADPSHPRDFDVRAELYAKAGVPEYWVVDLGSNTIRVHTSRNVDRYDRMRRYLGADTIALVCWPDIAILVSEILPE